MGNSESTDARRCVIYCRISEDRSGHAHGVERQEQDCRALAETLGYEVVRVFRDNDISAYSGTRRPEYRDMVATLESGTATAVLAWHPDRLHRSPRELEDYVDLSETHAILTHTVQSGKYDLSTPSGRMFARSIGAVARYESEHKSTRVRRARRQAVEEGRHVGGKRPFGFESDGVTHRPEEADAIRKTAARLLAGESLRSTSGDLNKAGIYTSCGNEWDSSGLKEMILRPRNAGWLVHRGEIVGPAPWDTIIPDDQRLALVSLLTDPARLTSTGTRASLLGSGLYRCGKPGCPGVMHSYQAAGKAKKYTAYRCATNRLRGGEGHPTRKAALVDEYVEEALIERLSRPLSTLLSSQQETDTTALYAELNALHKRLEDLASMFAEGQVTAQQLQKGSDKIRTRQEEIQERIGATAPGPVTNLVKADKVRSAWGNISLEVKRAVLVHALTVTILPQPPGRRPNGAYFDPEFIGLDWNY